MFRTSALLSLLLAVPVAAQAPAVVRLEILPGPRVLHAPARWQQLSVRAHFADGNSRDVTRLTVFSSSDPAIADVERHGLVEFKQPGEVAILVRYLETLQTVSLTYLEERPGFVWSNPPENNYVDKHVSAKLKLLGLASSELCSDEQFLRRAYLDLCALPPTPDEVRAFLKDPAQDKRARLIDRLLERPEFADFWTLKWMDVLRASRKTLGVKGVETLRAWLHNHVKKNTPFDQVVRELLTASGNTFEVGPANYFRAVRDPQELAETTAQLFLGVRMQCARCHNHPFEKWSQDDYYSLAAFFAGVRQKGEAGKKAKSPGAEVISYEPRQEVKHPLSGKTQKPRFPGGAVADLPRDADRRPALAEWLTRKDNTFFARAIVNRLWYHLLGKGIIDPPDDIRDSNPPANEALLDALARDFVAHNFDVKHVLRTILNSRTYQLTSRTNDWNKHDVRYFSHAWPRLLSAEQLLDAICAVTEVHEKFAGMPDGTRATQLPDSDFDHPFLKAFGKPARELACECERDGDSNLGQALQLVNGATVQTKLSAEKNRLGRLLGAKVSETSMLDELYLAALSRLPTPAERQTALEYLRTVEPRQGWEDILWALFNTKEFLFRH